MITPLEHRAGEAVVALLEEFLDRDPTPSFFRILQIAYLQGMSAQAGMPLEWVRHETARLTEEFLR